MTMKVRRAIVSNSTNLNNSYPNESLKLADLYVLECAVLSYCRGRNVDDDDALHRGDDDDDVRALASHRPTASYLLMWSDNRRRRSSRRGWEKAPGSTIDRATTMPFQCGRHRYVARLIARERTPSE